MNNKVFLRLAIGTIILAIIDIIIFSPGIIGLTFSTNAILFCLVILANIGIVSSEYIYLTHSTTGKYGYDLDKLKSANDYKDALESKLNRRSPFFNEVKQSLAELDSITRKKNVLNELLEQNNQQHFTALTDLADQATNFLFNNIRKILNRIAIFDSDIGNTLEKEHKEYMQKLLDSNENILKEFNKLLTEVSQMDDSPSSDDSLSKVLSDMTNSLKTLRGENDSLK